MNIFESEQLSVSTAQEESNYFTGQPPAVLEPNPNAILPPGLYRVIDGRLYRVVQAVAPSIQLRCEEIQAH
ncbi:MAG: hypothetical protein WCD04_20990 [Terriglobia bacterium]|jgi:hypothetical protein